MVSETKSHQQRIGHKLFSEIETIKRERIAKKLDKPTLPMSSEKITNMIANHRLWEEIKSKIINATAEEIKEYGE